MVHATCWYTERTPPVERTSVAVYMSANYSGNYDVFCV